MKNTENEFSGLIRFVEQKDLIYDKEKSGFAEIGVDWASPYLTMLLCLRGSGSALYDMREIRIEKNILAVIMPKHIVRLLECSEELPPRGGQTAHGYKVRGCL